MAFSAVASGLAYKEQGEGHPVVFLHGLTFNRSTWDPILERLQGGWRCVAVDLPGHGESTDLPYSIDKTLQRVHEVVTSLKLVRPVIVGHSSGAALASMYAANAPVAGVVNVDQPLDIRPFARMVKQFEPALRGPNFAAAFEPIRQSIGVEMLPEPLRSNTLSTQRVRQDVVLAYWNDLLLQSPDDLQALVDEMTSRITAPYLAVFGHRLSDEERIGFSKQLASLELEEWDGLGHMVHLMELDRFARRLDHFVRKCAAT